MKNFDSKVGRWFESDRSNMEYDDYLKSFQKQVKRNGKLYREQLNDFILAMYSMDDKNYKEWIKLLSKYTYGDLVNVVDYLVSVVVKEDSAKEAVEVFNIYFRQAAIIRITLRKLLTSIDSVSNKEAITILEEEIDKIQSGDSTYYKAAIETFEVEYKDVVVYPILNFYIELHDSMKGNMLKEVNRLLRTKANRSENEIADRVNKGFIDYRIKAKANLDKSR